MYGQYFSRLVKTKGTPILSADQFVRYQNIIALEYFILEIEKMGISHSLFQTIQKKRSQLERLTKKQSPEELIEEMVFLSRGNN